MNFRNYIIFCFSLFALHSSLFAQDAYFSSDSNKHHLFEDFVGIKLYAADFGTTSLNKDLQFNYVSVNSTYQYTFKHDFNVTGLNNIYNIGLGADENLGKHLQLNFLNVALGTNQHAWDWSLSAGAGYFISLNRERNLRLTGFLNVYYVNISYSFGSYYDSTQLGFEVDGVNVGTAIRNVKYLNNIWSISPGLELNYRRRNFDYFVGVTSNFVFTYYEQVTFYYKRIPINQAIYDNSGNPVQQNAINLNKYMISFGIIRELGI